LIYPEQVVQTKVVNQNQVGLKLNVLVHLLGRINYFTHPHKSALTSSLIKRLRHWHFAKNSFANFITVADCVHGT